VLEDHARPRGQGLVEVEPGTTSGDYLSGFWQGTREALHANGRQSVTITIDRVDARTLGALIALYERAVGFYATLINVNAYHQPGVEAGKKAAAAVLATQATVLDGLREQSTAVTAEQLADKLGISERVETVYHILEHLAANKRQVKRGRGGKYRWKG
jgi:glucose-6-phosphate isomerase